MKTCKMTCEIGEKSWTARSRDRPTEDENSKNERHENQENRAGNHSLQKRNSRRTKSLGPSIAESDKREDQSRSKRPCRPNTTFKI